MFSSKDSKKETEVSKPRNDGKPQVPSIISANLKIVGNLVSDGDVQVDGLIEGDVNSRSLMVSENASIHGEVEAETVRIHGTVPGQIKATNVALGPTARVLGDVIHTNLVIESGAFLEGHCKRLDGQPAEPEAVAVDDDADQVAA